jgi:hypothetical protein
MRPDISTAASAQIERLLVEYELRQTVTEAAGWNAPVQGRT